MGGVNCCIMFLSDLFNSIIINVFFMQKNQSQWVENVADIKAEK